MAEKVKETTAEMSFMEEEKEKGREVIYEIREHLGVLSSSPNGWKKELNKVAWNGTREKYDMRDWNEDHSSMSRGITLTQFEMKTLKSLLADVQL